MGPKFDTAIMDKVLDLEARTASIEAILVAQGAVNNAQVEINDSLEALVLLLTEGMDE